ncbi:MAG: beta-glucosidase BglX [candidate division KSB1 bacterium]|nr:beta-glucosidase BglX [candidate division KSB1 bacterium]
MRRGARILWLPMLWIVAGSTTAGVLTRPEIERKIDDLLARMTVEEKVGQLVQFSYPDVQNHEELIRQGRVGSFLNVRDVETANRLQRVAVHESRLGIPLIFGNDVIHGCRTIFPIPLAEAATWNPELVRRCARIAAREAASIGTHWTFAPMVDIARDPRWGRIAEGAGEDPYLGSVMARAKVEGFQGDDLSHPETIAACPKHYVAYGAAVGGRDYNTVDLSEWELREVYLPPFRAAIEAGAATIMSAFNDLCGVPASANSFTLTRILREEWGFDGFVVSDWDAIAELVSHGLAASVEEAAQLALQAGVDMDMMGYAYHRYLADLVQSGRVPMEWLDRSVRRVLRVKYLLGLFERPFVDPRRQRSVILAPEHLEVALQAAREAIVLLKNEGHVLPLPKSSGTVAVLGPLANNRADLLGSWSMEGRPEDVVTVLDAIREKIGTNRVLFAPGCGISDTSRAGIAEAVALARKATVAIVVVGESANMSGEGASRAHLDLPGVQLELVKSVWQAGVPTVVVLVNGRPLAIPWIAEHIPAIVESWQLGVQHGRAVADVLFGDFNPCGKLPATFPRSVGQVPIYYNHKNTGRPPQASERYCSKYIDEDWNPLYPFGFGLSYTTFRFENLRLSESRIRPYGKVTVTVDVVNVGSVAGHEVAQLYIRDVAASRTRPVKELRGFRKVFLRPGERATVCFELGPHELGFYNRHMEWVVEPGEFRVWVGPNSVEGLEARFEVVTP